MSSTNKSTPRARGGIESERGAAVTLLRPASAIDADSTGRARGPPPTLHFLPRRLEMDRINIWFGENRAMPLKRERVGDPVWARAVAVFNRLVRKEAGVFRL